MKAGSIVKWRDATVDGDNLLKVIIEDNGNRVIIEEIDARFSTWTIKPRSLAHKSDLIKIDKDQLQYLERK